LTGFFVQRNKAIVGKNAFAHESGVHQDGFLKKKDTYEIMNPTDIGLEESELVLGKHSGRNALSKRIQDLGYNLTDAELNEVFKNFKILADEKKDLFDEDIISLIQKQNFSEDDLTTYKLESLKCSFESGKIPEACVTILDRDNKRHEASANGDGPIDSIYNAIDKITGLSCKLIDYQVMSKTKGTDAQGEVTVRVISNNVEILGKGVGVNTIEASGFAYINAVNKLLFKTNSKLLESGKTSGP
jgi:2-isopropylmalate synthase